MRPHQVVRELPRALFGTSERRLSARGVRRKTRGDDSTKTPATQEPEDTVQKAWIRATVLRKHLNIQGSRYERIRDAERRHRCKQRWGREKSFLDALNPPRIRRCTNSRLVGLSLCHRASLAKLDHSFLNL